MDNSCKKEFKRYFENCQFKTGTFRENALTQNKSYFDFFIDSYNKINSKFIESIIQMDAQVTLKSERDAQRRVGQRPQPEWNDVINRILNGENIEELGLRVDNAEDRRRIIQFIQQAQGDEGLEGNPEEEQEVLIEVIQDNNGEVNHNVENNEQNNEDDEDDGDDEENAENNFNDEIE